MDVRHSHHFIHWTMILADNLFRHDIYVMFRFDCDHAIEPKSIYRSDTQSLKQGNLCSLYKQHSPSGQQLKPIKPFESIICNHCFGDRS